MKSANNIEKHFIEANRRTHSDRNALLFVQGRLLLDFVWLSLLNYSSPLSSSSATIGVIILFPIGDALLLPIFYAAIRRRPQSIALATGISAILTAVGIAITIHWVGDFTWPGFLLYFILTVVAALANPWIIAAISSTAYLAVVLLEITGLSDPASGKSIVEMREHSLLAVFALTGMWLIATLMKQVLTIAELTQRDQARMMEEIRRRAEQESIWSTVGKTVIASQDLDQFLTDVIRVLNEKMQVEAGSILLLDHKTNELYFAKTLRGNVAQPIDLHIPIGQGIAGWVAKIGQPTIVANTSQDPRWLSEVDSQIGFAIRAIICVPLIAKGELCGIIELFNKQDAPFNEHDLNLLQLIASPVTIAIQNAQLHSQVQNQLNELFKLFRQVELAKREWEETVDAIDEGITLVDERGSILRANSTLANWLNTTPSAMVGQLCYAVVHGSNEPPSYCPHAQALTAQKQISSSEFYEPRLGVSYLCTSYPFHDSTGKLTGTVNVFKDITIQKRMQQQLIQSEKLAAVGQLATSLAHEINNPLQGIKGCLDLIRADLAENSQSLEFLEMTQGEIERLSVIVQRMLDFYRPAHEQARPINVRTTVENTLSLSAKRLEQANISVRKEWAENLPVITGVDNQLKQVFLNLILNAIESMPEGGTLKVNGYTQEDQGQWVIVNFTDSGMGIAPEMLERIFDPFFTTKNDGTGLGLAICNTLVSSHGGRMQVNSRAGAGSTFSVWLPV